MSNGISAFLRSKALILAVSVAFVACATVTVIFAKTRNNARNKTTAEVSSPQGQPSYKQRVRVWIHGDGIRPQILHAKPGLVILTVENKTILDAELVVERVLPNQVPSAVGAIAISRERERRNQEFLLAEGEYVLYERSRPGFKADLIVSP